MSKVSVIMPSLNVAKYIKQCIDSVINQTLKDIEIIMIDAGSTDGTLEILEDYARRDTRIVLLHSDIKSYGYQMNIGIKKASGEYIGIVETDDYAEPDMFEKLYDSAKKHDAEIVKGLMYVRYEYKNFRSIETFGDYLAPYPGISEAVINPKDDADVYLYNSNLWNGIYKKSFLIANSITFNETPGAAYQDIGFHYQIFNCAKRVVYIRVYLYHYRFRRDGSSSCSDKVLKNVYQEYKWLYDTGSLRLDNKNVLFKMGYDILTEYLGVLQHCDFNRCKIQYTEELEWFRKIFLSLDCYKAFSPKAIERDFYLFLLNNGWLEEDYKYKVGAIQKWLSSFQDNASKNGIVLFGAGNFGVFLAGFLIRNGLPPVAYIDNNEKLWGTVFKLSVKDAPRIESPYSAFQAHRTSTYLIASRHYGKVIQEQILAEGIDRNNIVIYDGRDLFLTDAISKIPYLYGS